jgi:putative PIN family toxin of toxin-antitoxin system
VRLVIDTNVIVSALLHPERTPDRALARIHQRGATVLVDDRITAEYRAVLARAKFAAIDPERRDALLERLLSAAEHVIAPPLVLAMIDDGDRAFAEVARGGDASAIVTGNAKHFPRELGVEVLSPAELLAHLG